MKLGTTTILYQASKETSLMESGSWLEVEWQRIQGGRNKQVHHGVIQKGPRIGLGISHNHHESNRRVKLTTVLFSEELFSEEPL